MDKPISKYGSLWTQEELILALYLYLQIPFSKTTRTNPEVIKLANILGRTPSSVARKLGNFGAFDDKLAVRGISGLTHYGKSDKEIWNKFSGNLEALIEESQKVLANLGENEIAVEPLTSEPEFDFQASEETEKIVSVSVRLKQSFFRKSVLASYGNLCCVCQSDLPELLIASHIIPWAVNKETRIDPRNGLSLCVLHDKAFDKGLIGIKSNFTVVVSPRVNASKSKFVQETLLAFSSASIQLPSRFIPKEEYLNWHLENVYDNLV